MATKSAARKGIKNTKEAPLSEKCYHLKHLFHKVEIDLPKFEDKSNKSAGIRIRKAMQDIKSLAQDIRMQILNASK